MPASAFAGRETLRLVLELGEGLRQRLHEAPQLHDGRWLSIPVLDETDAVDVEQLLLVKMRLPRGRG